MRGRRLVAYGDWAEGESGLADGHPVRVRIHSASARREVSGYALVRLLAALALGV
jgi:hypothetical protein